MPKWVTGLLDYLPEQGKQLLAYLAAMAAGLYLLRKIISHLQSKEIKAALRAVKKTGISFGQALAKQATPPKNYPCAQFFLEVIFTANNYLAALTFFSLFLTVSVLAITGQGLPFLNFLAVMGFAVICLYFALFLFAEAERQRLALPTLWSACRCANRANDK